MGSRARPNVEPKFGGKACPHYTETQPCNLQPCGCQTASGFKAHGSKYAGHNMNFCNQCRCHAGVEICTKRQCHVHSAAQICASTTCVYGARFGTADDLLSTAQAAATYGANWQSQPHEMTTLVRHHSRDANGAKFTCGHVKHTEECRCYCSDKGTKSIWHRADRHADSIRKGLTSAGCKCKSSWSYKGQTYSGCQNPSSTPNPLVNLAAHGEKHSTWCKIEPGTCKVTHARAVKAGSDWDTCETHAHLHIPVSL